MGVLCDSCTSLNLTNFDATAVGGDYVQEMSHAVMQRNVALERGLWHGLQQVTSSDLLQAHFALLRILPAPEETPILAQTSPAGIRYNAP